MNTNTSAASAAESTGAVIATAPFQTHSLAHIDAKLKELNTDINRLLAEREDARKQVENERRETILKLPAQYGFSSMDEFLSFCRSLTPRQQAAKGLRHGRAFSDELVAELKRMIREGKSAKEVKKELGISIPSYYAYKHQMGLTKPHGRSLKVFKPKRRGRRSHKNSANSAPELAAAK